MTLPFAQNRGRAVRDVALTVQVGGHGVVPEDGANAGWVWIEHRVVVVVFDDDIGVLLGGRDQDFGVVVVLSHQHGVHVGGGVQVVALSATSLNELTVDLLTVDQTGGGKTTLLVRSPSKPSFVDLAELGSVFGLASLAAGGVQSGEQKADENRDDRHDHEELDEGKAAFALHR